MTNFKVVSFNVFPGSPIPYIGGGFPKLAFSKRLGLQLEGLSDLDADVLCLQELYCIHSLEECAPRLGDQCRNSVEE